MKKFLTLAVPFLLVSFVLFSTAFAAEAPKKVLIGVSKIVSHPALDAVVKGLQDELAAAKINAEYDLQNANGDINAAASIAAKFRSEKVTLAVGVATPTSQSLVNTLKGIPIVFTAVTDPVKAGIVKQVCKELNIEFVETTVSKSSEVKQAVQAIIRRVDALYISTDNTVVSAMSAVSDVAMKARVPIMSADPSSAENYPVLAAWGFDYYKMGRTTGKIVVEILKGKKPEQIPTQFMTKTSDVDLLINLDVAKKLGLTFPKDIVKSANKIVENGKLTKK